MTDDYEQLRDEAYRAVGAVVVVWNMIDEALFRSFIELAGLPDKVAAAYYAGAASLGPRLRLIRTLIDAEVVTGESATAWTSVLDAASRLATDRNNLIHSPLLWNNGALVLGVRMFNDEDGEITLQSADGRGFWVRKSAADQLAGRKTGFRDYDVQAIRAHVSEANELLGEIWGLLR